MMKEDRNAKSHVSWCLKQKRGIKIEEPNNNLCKAYIKKAKSSLNMLVSAIEKDEIDWISTTAYYARYFAIYALLQKCGIRSEIHDCTISLMHLLFVEENIIDEHYYNELQTAKELRIEIQYYSTEEIDLNNLKKNSETASTFLLQVEEAIEKINEKQIWNLRQKVIETRS